MCFLRSATHRTTVRRLSVLQLPVVPTDDDLSCLSSFSNLERIDICGHCGPFHHLRLLFEALTRLRHLDVSGSPLNDFQPLLSAERARVRAL